MLGWFGPKLNGCNWALSCTGCQQSHPPATGLSWVLIGLRKSVSESFFQLNRPLLLVLSMPPHLPRIPMRSQRRMARKAQLWSSGLSSMLAILGVLEARKMKKKKKIRRRRCNFVQFFGVAEGQSIIADMISITLQK